MSIIGIVSEFNPFHMGHKYLIDAVKGEGDTVVCVMSGNFVQRGEPALFPKEVRVRAALYNGADIVLELPFVYATASAECFAFNAVKILNDFGCDKLAFGTESATATELEKVVNIINNPDFDEKLKQHLETGVSYPTARQLALNEYETSFDISTPNNILAVEYVKAIKKLNSKMEICPVVRVGAGYNDEQEINGIASATHIRKLIKENKDFSEYVPKNIYEIYCSALNNGEYLNPDKFNISALALLRTNGVNSKTANMAEGLENRIKTAIKSSVSLEEIYANAKTKRYTHSRIRRAVLCATLNVSEDVLKISVPYCRLLGFNQEANSKLGELASKCKLPFVANYSDIEYSRSVFSNIIFDYENKATDLFNLSLQKSKICSSEMTYCIIKI